MYLKYRLHHKKYFFVIYLFYFFVIFRGILLWTFGITANGPEFESVLLLNFNYSEEHFVKLMMY
jgi:hypothetical protein